MTRQKRSGRTASGHPRLTARVDLSRLSASGPPLLTDQGAYRPYRYTASWAAEHTSALLTRLLPFPAFHTRTEIHPPPPPLTVRTLGSCGVG